MVHAVKNPQLISVHEIAHQKCPFKTTVTVSWWRAKETKTKKK